MPVIRAETIGPVTLVLGDCLVGQELTDFTPPGTVAAVITDPPYCSGGFTEASRRTAKSMGVKSEALGWFEGDNMTTLGLQFLLRSIAIDSWTMLRKGGTLSLFMDWRMIPAVAPAIESARLRWQQLVVWDKKSAGLGNGFRAQHETLLHFAKGVPLYNSPKHGNVLSVGRPREREHPTEKPVELLAKIIETVCEPGALIVDWFGGAGSTAVAAIETGRRAVVFEVDPVFHARAIERCRAALGQGKLFAPAQRSEQDGLELGTESGADPKNGPSTDSVPSPGTVSAMAVEALDAGDLVKTVNCPTCGGGPAECMTCADCNGTGLLVATADPRRGLREQLDELQHRLDALADGSGTGDAAAAALEDYRKVDMVKAAPELAASSEVEKPEVEHFPGGDIGVGGYAETVEFVRDTPPPLPKRVECPDCGGSGDGEWIEGEGTVQCARCNGCGLVTAEEPIDAEFVAPADPPPGLVEGDPGYIAPKTDDDLGAVLRADPATAAIAAAVDAAYIAPAEAFKAEPSCERCRGEGWIRNAETKAAEDCPRCGGSGDAGVRDQCPPGHVNIACPACGGRGDRDGAKCATCLGFGQVNFYAIPEAKTSRTCMRTGQPLLCFSRLCAAAGRCTREAEAATAGALL